MSRLGLYLQSRGLITRDQLDDALSHQAVQGARLGTNLVELGYLSIEQLAACLADFHQVPLPERRWLERPQRAATQRATRSLVERIRFIPMRLDGKVLHAALLDPRHPNVLDDLRFATGCRIEPYVLPEIWMHDWLLQLFKLPRGIRHVETRGTLDESTPPPSRAAPRASKAARATPARGSASVPLTRPPPRFESARPPPVFDSTVPAPLFETTAMAHASATTPAGSVRPISGLPPIPSQAPGPRRATNPPPFRPLSAPNGRSVRPPPVPVRTLAGGPLPSIEETSWSWRAPQPAAVPIHLELDEEDPDSIPDITAFGPTASTPPPPSVVPPAHHSSTPAGLWRESTPPTAAPPVLAAPAASEESTGELELPALSPEPQPEPAALDQLEPATAAQTLATDLASWEAELLAAANRDQLIEVTFRIASCFASHVALFIVHQGMVQGQSSMENGIARALDGVLVPLDAQSAITEAATRGEPLRASPMAQVIDERISLILCDEAREVALFPVAIKQRVVNVLYASTGGEPLGAIAFGALSQLAQQMGAAYGRLILSRKASSTGA